MIKQIDVVNSKIIAEEDLIAQNFSRAVSQLKAQTDLMLDISAYLFSGNADEEHIAEVTAKFQDQVPTLFTDIIPKLQAIESCGNAENGAANLAQMITDYSLDPSTFVNRYK